MGKREEIAFFKMQGLGNDYVYVIDLEAKIPDLPGLAREISDRHFGIGGDGLIVIRKSDVADFRMRMFNADGSEAQMCGNASRCIARLVYGQGLISRPEMTLETLAGIKLLKLNIKDGGIESVSVNMGAPLLTPEGVPYRADIRREEGALNTVVADCDGRRFEIIPVGMGNPHGVIFTSVSEDDFQKYGPLLEHHEIWPEKANIEFVKILSPSEIEMRVWERGTGETLACGTGACASAVASLLSGKASGEVKVKMKGGTLRIALNGKGEVIMTGDAQLVAKGIYYRQN